MNKILAFLGLVKIKRVRHLTGLLHLYHNQCITNAVQKDFNVLPIKNSQKIAENWWKEEFNSILKHNTDNVKIITEPVFLN